MKKTSGWTVSIAVATGLLTGCGEKPVQEPPPVVRPVKMETARPEPPVKVYYASGVLKAARRAELSFERSDTLIEFPVRQGQEVAGGQVLAKIETRNLDILQRSAQARYEEAAAQFQRIERLYRKQALAQADLGRARAALETARAEWEQIGRDLEQSVLKAPFAGRVAATYAELYQAVPARQPILVLHDISSFKIRIELPETFVLEAGAKAEVQAVAVFDHLPGREFPAQVNEYSTEADPATLTYAVELEMPTVEGGSLLPGMSAEIRLTVSGESPAGVWVPQTAVFSEDGQQACVWSVDDQMRTVRKPVRTGLQRAGAIQILDGLSAGETVAVSGVHALREGMAVKPYTL